MKKILFASLVSVIAISCGSNAKETAVNTEVEIAEAPHSDVSVEENLIDTVNAPIIEIENDTYTFGEAKEGEKVRHEYAFTNTGKTPLIISSVNASCGCTTPNYPKQPIKPGETAKIEVVFDTKNQPGMQHKVITMISNAHPSQTIFHLKGEVK